MKTTKKKVLFFILHVLFSAVAPLVLVIIQYSNIGDTKEAVGFKVSITGILLLLFIFCIIKKLFVDGRLADLKAQSNTMIAGLKTKQDAAEITALEREIKRIRTIEVLVATITPLLCTIAVIIAFRALEAQLVRLSATLCWIAVSFAVGTVFSILHAREVSARGDTK